MSRQRLRMICAALIVVALFLVARQAASRRPQKLGSSGRSQQLQLSQDGRYLLTQSDRTKDSAYLWDMKSSQKLRALPLGTLLVSPDNSQIAQVDLSRTYSETARDLFQPRANFQGLRDGRPKYDAQVPEKLPFNWTTGAAFSGDSRHFWLATMRYWYRFDAADGKFIERIRPQHKSFYAIFSPDATRVLCGFDGATWICETKSGRYLKSLANSTQDPAFWSPDGKVCVQTKNAGYGARFWDAQSGKLLLDWSSAKPVKIHFLSGSKQFVVSGQKGLEVRAVATGKLLATPSGPTQEPFVVAPDGGFAISLDLNSTLWKWQLK